MKIMQTLFTPYITAVIVVMYGVNLSVEGGLDSF